MKDRHILFFWAAFVLLILAGLTLSSMGEAARPYEYAGIALLVVLFVVGVIVVVLRFCKSTYQHWLDFQTARHMRKTQIHEGQVQAHTRTVQAYELEERKSRCNLEKAKIEAEIHAMLTRVPQGMYLIQPDMALDPSEQDIVYLPMPVQPRYQGQGRARQIEAEPQHDLLPTHVRYEDVRFQVPRGHVLVGIGEEGLETKGQSVGACVWIVGLSGTGKTSTTFIRVEERRAAGHKFLGIDPHWFKPDSLTNAIRAYEPDFLMPMAKTPEENLVVLQAFLDEFQARKAGEIAQPWQPITLLVDEVGSLMDSTNSDEKAVKDLLPSIARICGQEARNFEMGGIFISQQATGLAWLRKVALMVIVHQLLQESEKKLATVNDTNAMADMKRWPIGRTYVYGVGFGKEGPRTVQQPYFGQAEQSDAVQDDGDNGPDDFAWEAEQDALEEMEVLQARIVESDPEPDGVSVDDDPLAALLTEEEREALDLVDGGAGPREIERSLMVTYYRARQLWQNCQDYRKLYPAEPDGPVEID